MKVLFQIRPDFMKNPGETLKALKALYILFFLIKLKTLEAI